MTNYEKLLELEEYDNVEILVKNKATNDEYIINSTVMGEVALFHVAFADGSRDKIISKEEFNTNYEFI